MRSTDHFTVEQQDCRDHGDGHRHRLERGELRNLQMKPSRRDQVDVCEDGADGVEHGQVRDDPDERGGHPWQRCGQRPVVTQALHVRRSKEHQRERRNERRPGDQLGCQIVCASDRSV